MKKITKLALLPILFGLTGCNLSNNRPDVTSSSSEEQKFEGQVVFNEFETIDDLYNVKQLLQEISYACEIQMNIDHEIVKNGNGSLKIDYGNGIYGQIYQRLAMSKIKDCNVDDIKNVSIWVYNPNNFIADFELNVVGLETSILSTHTEQIEPNEWKLVTYEINKIALDAYYEDVRGFSFFFAKNGSTTYPATFYVDDFAVTFGAEISQDDKYYLDQVDTIVSYINNLPEIIRANDIENINLCKTIASLYSELPSEYKPAVTNYQTFQLALQTYVDAYAESESVNSDVTAYHFDSCFGLAQLSFSYTHTQFGIGLSKEKKYKNEEASLDLDLNGKSEWLDVYMTSPINMQNYDYLEFAIYNDCDYDVAFCLTWDTLHIVKPNEWVEFSIPTRYAEFAPSFLIELEITGCDADYFGDSNAHAPTGHVYFSRVMLHRDGADKFLELLDTLPTTCTYEDEELVESIRAFYENLHKDEKAKISNADLERLVNAEKQIVSANYSILGDLIDNLPEVNNVKPYHAASIAKAYKIYETMDSSDVANYITSIQENKIKALFEAIDGKIETVIDCRNFVGTNIGNAWDTRCNSILDSDEEYGDIANMSISSITGNNLGAFEFSFDKIDTSKYTSIKFYVKSDTPDVFYISRSPWRGGDHNLGYLFETNLIADTWTEITIPAADFASACFMEFYFTTEINIGSHFYFSSIFGLV